MMRDVLTMLALLAMPFILMGGMYLLVPKTQSYHQKFVQHCEQGGGLGVSQWTISTPYVA